MSRHHIRIAKRRRWQHARRRALDRDGWRCTKCGHAGRLEVHHVESLNEGGEPYALSNLATLCRDCHIEMERRSKTPAEEAWGGLVADSLARTRISSGQ